MDSFELLERELGGYVEEPAPSRVKKALECELEKLRAQEVWKDRKFWVDVPCLEEIGKEERGTAVETFFGKVEKTMNKKSVSVEKTDSVGEFADVLESARLGVECLEAYGKAAKTMEDGTKTGLLVGNMMELIISRPGCVDLNDATPDFAFMDIVMHAKAACVKDVFDECRRIKFGGFPGKDVIDSNARKLDELEAMIPGPLPRVGKCVKAVVEAIESFDQLENRIELRSDDSSDEEEEKEDDDEVMSDYDEEEEDESADTEDDAKDESEEEVSPVPTHEAIHLSEAVPKEDEPAQRERSVFANSDTDSESEQVNSESPSNSSSSASSSPSVGPTAMHAEMKSLENHFSSGLGFGAVNASKPFFAAAKSENVLEKKDAPAIVQFPRAEEVFGNKPEKQAVFEAPKEYQISFTQEVQKESSSGTDTEDTDDEANFGFGSKGVNHFDLEKDESSEETHDAPEATPLKQTQKQGIKIAEKQQTVSNGAFGAFGNNSPAKPGQVDNPFRSGKKVESSEKPVAQENTLFGGKPNNASLVSGSNANPFGKPTEVSDPFSGGKKVGTTAKASVNPFASMAKPAAQQGSGFSLVSGSNANPFANHTGNQSAQVANPFSGK